MSTSDKPITGRWTDAGSDAPPQLVELLQAGRAALGTADEIERLQASLAARLGPSAGLDSAPSGVHAARPSSALPSSWISGAAVATLIGGVAWWLVSRPPEPLTSPPPSAVSTSVDAEVMSLPAAELAPAEPLPAEPPPSVPPSASDAASTLSPSEPAAPAKREAEKPKARRAPAARAKTPPAPRESEAELLARAQAALAERPAAALQLAERHRRLFPSGVLAQEREVIAIEALKRLGRERAAQDKASEFESRYKGSIHQPRLRGTPTELPSKPRDPAR